MNILFLGNTGVHHAIIAAHIFLNRLPENDFGALPGFCDIDLDISGAPIYVGEDKNKSTVYTLGAGKNYLLMKKTIEEVRALLGYSPHDLIVKPISVRGEKALQLLEKIPVSLGGSHINYFFGTRLLKRQFNSIKKEIDIFKKEIDELSKQKSLNI